MGPLECFIVLIHSAALWPWGRCSLWQKWVPRIFPVGKGGRCVGLTTLPSSCLKILATSVSCSPQSPSRPTLNVLSFYSKNYSCARQNGGMRWRMYLSNKIREVYKARIVPYWILFSLFPKISSWLTDVTLWVLRLICLTYKTSDPASQKTHSFFLLYSYQLVNAVQCSNPCLLWESYTHVTNAQQVVFLNFKSRRYI